MNAGGMRVPGILALTLAAALGVSGMAHAKPTDAEIAKVSSAGGYARLLSRIQSDGRVRVIVTLKTEFKPMADPDSPASRDQMSRIGRAQDDLLAELRPFNVRGQRKFRFVPQMSMWVHAGALQGLLASGRVAGVQEDVPDRAHLDLSVPRIGAPSVWGGGSGGAGITVAVLDTGVDKNHGYLAGSVVSEACYSSNDTDPDTLEIVSASVCPGGAQSSTAVNSAMPYGGNCPSGECDHGTHVAGIVAGRDGVAGSPGPGVAPDANILAIQVFSRFDSEVYCGPGQAPCALSWNSDQISALERVYALRSTYAIASVNMSIGGGKYSSNCDANSRKPIIDQLRAAGIATVISAGNDGFCASIGSPACISSAVSVGATDDFDGVASYSNSASFVSLFAPGSSINSSLPGGGYTSWNGTSMAAPHVAGAWALMKQENPSWTVDQILSAFTSTGVTVTDSGKCSAVTKQRINANDADLGTPLLTFSGALDAPSLVWVQGGDADWYGQTAGTHDTVDAGRSGAIMDDQSSWVETTVAGPGTLTFWWMVSSEDDWDYLRFKDNGSQVAAVPEISGTVDWQQMTYTVPSGSHTLRWSYEKDSVCCSDGYDAGGLDQVVWMPDPPGALSVTPAEGLTSSGVQGGPFSPPSQIFTLENTGGISIDWTASKTMSWVTLSSGGGSLGPGGSVGVTVSINAAADSLAPGPYGDTVTVTNTTNGTGNTTRSVSLTVQAPGALSVTPVGGLASSGIQGGPFSPLSQMYTLENTGGTSIDWTASKTMSWVTLSSGGGSLGPGGSVDVTVSINAGADSLAPGPFSDTVTITNTTNGTGNTTRSVSLTVQAPGALSVTPVNNLSSAGRRGGPFTPLSQMYNLQNTGDGSIDWTASKTMSWVTLSSSGGTLAGGGSTDVTVSINSGTDSLAVGSYDDTVTFMNTTNAAGNATRAVNLAVRGRGYVPLGLLLD